MNGTDPRTFLSVSSTFAHGGAELRFTGALDRQTAKTFLEDVQEQLDRGREHRLVLDLTAIVDFDDVGFMALIEACGLARSQDVAVVLRPSFALQRVLAALAPFIDHLVFDGEESRVV